MDLQPLTSGAQAHRVVFGVYRDGDNNLDAVQERNVTDFIRSTAANPALKVVAEDTTSQPRAPFQAGDLRTESSVIENGRQRFVRVEAARDMSDRATLARFVERTLDEKAADPRFKDADVWLDLVDHGGGDGGGLQADSSGGFMSVDDIAGAIADGRASFDRTHRGGDDRITGVLANQCLMASLGFEASLSRAGVHYLAASPETMLAPGAPSAKIADALTRGGDWPQAVVDATMDERYRISGDVYHPAAAFDVLDVSPDKIDRVRGALRSFNDAVAALPRSSAGVETVRGIRADIRSVRGMVRYDHGADLPWHADRPAEAVFDAIAADSRLDANLRNKAAGVASAVRDSVVAHGEAGMFAPFRASYADSAGPTAHLPLTRRQYDPWADQGVAETSTAFYDDVDGPAFARRIGAYEQVA